MSFGRVKMELFESADVTASIYKPSEQALGLRKDICLSVIGFRISQRYRVDGNNFENPPRVGADISIPRSC